MLFHICCKINYGMVSWFIAPRGYSRGTMPKMPEKSERQAPPSGGTTLAGGIFFCVERWEKEPVL